MMCRKQQSSIATEKAERIMVRLLSSKSPQHTEGPPNAEGKRIILFFSAALFCESKQLLSND